MQNTEDQSRQQDIKIKEPNKQNIWIRDLHKSTVCSV
jgi:hypothetical protein